MLVFDGTHLVGDNDIELHRIAKLIGLKCEWYQRKGDLSHYDVFGKPKERLMRDHHPKLVSPQELINFCYSIRRRQP